jgi:two-component system NtrC family sensor kinase
MQHADGGWVWIESRARITARDELGRPTRLTGVHLDITERRRADEELVLSRERALRAEHLAALGTLAAGTAHELNSPLGAILLAASYGLEIAADADPEALTECLRDIERQARRGRDVVESVLLFAADERADRRPTSLADVVEEAVRAVAPDAAAHGATIEVLPHEPLPDMLVNRMNVSRAFVNLLKNAVESGEGVAVTVRLGRGDGTVRVAVSDTGRGISAEAAGRIFDPFYTTRRERGGTGLGLSITHGIVRRHGGTIRVESAPGAGTTFTVELPLSAANSVGARGGWRRSW